MKERKNTKAMSKGLKISKKNRNSCKKDSRGHINY